MDESQKPYPFSLFYHGRNFFPMFMCLVTRKTLCFLLWEQNNLFYFIGQMNKYMLGNKIDLHFTSFMGGSSALKEYIIK